MKVLHVLQTSFPSLTGYCIRSNGIMQALKKHGWSVVAMTGAVETGGKAEWDEIEGIRYYRTLQPVPSVPSPLREWKLSRLLAARLPAVIAAERPDLIHVHSPAYNGLTALRAARQAGLPCVYEMRAVWEDAAVDQNKFKESSMIYRASAALETYVLRRATADVVICHGLEGEVLSRGIPREKLFVAPNGVDAESFEPPPRDPEVARRLGLEGRYVFGFIGSFFNYEGVEDLIDAAPAVWAKHPEAAFLIMGGGERDAAVREKIARLNDPRMVYSQRVRHNQVKAYYSVVDCLVYPRRSVRLTELVTPLKPLEAMAMQKLVVASDIGGHREMVEHEKFGFLYDLKRPGGLSDALCRVLDQPDLSSRLALAGREYVLRERSWLRTTENHLRAYRYALAKNAPGQAAGKP